MNLYLFQEYLSQKITLQLWLSSRNEFYNHAGIVKNLIWLNKSTLSQTTKAGSNSIARNEYKKLIYGKSSILATAFGTENS
jgi:hypothetical protein